MAMSQHACMDLHGGRCARSLALALAVAGDSLGGDLALLVGFLGAPVGPP